MNWWIQRLVISKDIPDGLADIRRFWSCRDVLEAHMTLDTLEAVRDIMRKEAERKAKLARQLGGSP